MTKRAKILYGICGIGMGHTYRQLPILEALVRDDSQVMIFAYGESLRFYKSWAEGKSSVRVEPVSVPFYMGNADGLDFAATAQNESGRSENRDAINCAALAKAQEFLGKPDLVISDYEPICAQFAYAHGAPLVTIDQQSKYLVGRFHRTINGNGYADEVARLRMFFPRAELRIACSFFQVPPKADKREKVTVCAPIIKDSILNMVRKPAANGNQILVYVSSQKEFVQDLGELVDICKSQINSSFHIFLPKVDERIAGLCAQSNVTVYQHGDSRFNEVLKTCNGIVTTGGHTLLSEAMHLGIPCYVVPLAVFEQQMNAYVIETNHFGMARPRVTAKALGEFIGQLDDFSAAIKDDSTVLLRGSGEKRIIAAIKRRLQANQ